MEMGVASGGSLEMEMEIGVAPGGSLLRETEMEMGAASGGSLGMEMKIGVALGDSLAKNGRDNAEKTSDVVVGSPLDDVEETPGVFGNLSPIKEVHSLPIGGGDSEMWDTQTLSDNEIPVDDVIGTTICIAPSEVLCNSVNTPGVDSFVEI
jgi:hypothetical protein